MPNTTVMQAKRLGVLTCTPDTRLVEAAQRMTGEDVSALVVVDEEGLSRRHPQPHRPAPRMG